MALLYVRPRRSDTDYEKPHEEVNKTFGNRFAFRAVETLKSREVFLKICLPRATKTFYPTLKVERTVAVIRKKEMSRTLGF